MTKKSEDEVLEGEVVGSAPEQKSARDNLHANFNLPFAKIKFHCLEGCSSFIILAILAIVFKNLLLFLLGLTLMLWFFTHSPFRRK